MEYENNTLIDVTTDNTGIFVGEILTDEIPEQETTVITETVYIKEDRPFFTTPIDEYTVTEGLLLLLFVITFLNNIFKQHLKGN